VLFRKSEEKQAREAALQAARDRLKARSEGRCRSPANAARCGRDDGNATIQVGGHDVPS
jgi:hypothetical protein